MIGWNPKFSKKRPITSRERFLFHAEMPDCAGRTYEICRDIPWEGHLPWTWRHLCAIWRSAKSRMCSLWCCQFSFTLSKQPQSWTQSHLHLCGYFPATIDLPSKSYYSFHWGAFFSQQWPSPAHLQDPKHLGSFIWLWLSWAYCLWAIYFITLKHTRCPLKGHISTSGALFLRINRLPSKTR